MQFWKPRHAPQALWDLVLPIVQGQLKCWSDAHPQAVSQRAHLGGAAKRIVSNLTAPDVVVRLRQALAQEETPMPLSPPCMALCDVLAARDAEAPWTPGDAQVLQALIQGLRWSAEMQACIHGVAAGIVAHFETLAETERETL